MSVGKISDNIWFVSFAYIAAFLPWSFLAAKDFVSPRWKTIEHTRTTGWYIARLSAFPTCYVMAYMIVQGLSADYKEMCVALVAFLFSCFNLLRTLWGLWQLHYFRQWAITSISALTAIGVKYAATSPAEQNLKEIEHIANHLLVNDTIVDNQLAHSEARCFLKYRDLNLNGDKDNKPQVVRYLYSVWLALCIVVRWGYDYGRHIFCDAPHYSIEIAPLQPTNMWLNWSVAFTAQGLGGWLRDFSAHRDPGSESGYNDAASKERVEKRGQHFGLQLVSSAWLQMWCENELPRDSSSTNPFHWCDLCDKESFIRDGLKKELLAKAMESGIALPFGASHDMMIRKDSEQANRSRIGYHAYRRKLDQIVNDVLMRGEFDEKVGDFDVEKLEWLTILLYIGTIAVRRQEDSSEKARIRPTGKDGAEDDEEEMNNS